MNVQGSNHCQPRSLINSLALTEWAEQLKVSHPGQNLNWVHAEYKSEVWLPERTNLLISLINPINFRYYKRPKNHSKSFDSIISMFGPFRWLQDHVNLYKRHQNGQSEYLTGAHTDRPIFLPKPSAELTNSGATVRHEEHGPAICSQSKVHIVDHSLEELKMFWIIQGQKLGLCGDCNPWQVLVCVILALQQNKLHPKLSAEVCKKTGVELHSMWQHWHIFLNSHFQNIFWILIFCLYCKTVDEKQTSEYLRTHYMCLLSCRVTQILAQKLHVSRWK